MRWGASSHPCVVTLGVSALMPWAITYLGSSCTLSAREAGEPRCSICSNFSLQGHKDSIHVSQDPVDMVSGRHGVWEARCLGAGQAVVSRGDST